MNSKFKMCVFALVFAAVMCIPNISSYFVDSDTETNTISIGTVDVPTAFLYDDGSIVFCNNQWGVNSSKTLTMTYTGWDTEQYSNDKQPWYNQMADITSVTIEDGVIPASMDNWFYGATNLNTVHLGEGIASIGDAMFFNCKMLTGDIVIPESVITIGANSFALTSITGVHIGSYVEVIGDEAFYSTDLGDELVIPDSVVTIGGRAFYNTSIVGVNFGSGVQTIGFRAFYSCRDLADHVVFPDSLITIENEAFAGCWSLDEITFGANVTNIGTDAFLNGLSNPIVTTIHGGNDLVWNYDWVGANRDVTFTDAPNSVSSTFNLQGDNEEVEEESTEPATTTTEVTSPEENSTLSTEPNGDEGATKPFSDVEGSEPKGEVDESIAEDKQVGPENSSGSEPLESSTESTVSPSESVETTGSLKESNS